MGSDVEKLRLEAHHLRANRVEDRSGRSCLEEETEVFNRRIARMDEQLRRLQTRDWRPPKFRTKEGKQRNPSESGLRAWAGSNFASISTPLRQRIPASEAASPISNRSEDESPSSRPSREASTEVDTSATSEAQAAFLLREQQLLMELSESQGEVAKLANLVQDREEQIRRLAVCSPSDRTARTEASTAEQLLRAELTEREREVEALRQAECTVERHAAQELRKAKVEMAETRRQQEILALEMQEAELQKRSDGASLLQMLRSPEAPAELKRAHLKEAVIALKQLVQELTLNEACASETPDRSRSEARQVLVAGSQVDSLDTTLSTVGTMPSIPEEGSECSGSPCSPAAGIGPGSTFPEDKRPSTTPKKTKEAPSPPRCRFDAEEALRSEYQGRFRQVPFRPASVHRMLKSFGLENLAQSHGNGAMIRSRRAAPPLGVKSTKSLGKSNVENSLADLRELENLEESEAQPLAPDRLREFLKDSCGSVLRAWAHVFDSNNDQRISREEFKSGLKKLNFNGENAAMKLFNLLDKDSSGEITLEEIDLLSDRKWRAFRQYCVKRFQSVEDLMQQLASLAMAFEDGSEVDTKKKPRVESLSKVEFMLGMINSGWPGEDKELEEVWMALRDASDDMMRVSGRDGPGLAWFGIEMRRFNRKKAAKIKSKQWFALRSRQGLNPAMIQKCFEEFKTSLRKKHGNLIRAWRQELSTNDAMSIAKVKFLRAAAKLGWSREAKDLWRALDKDESGTASLDELDPVGAEILANFKVWVDSEFGGIRNAFRKIDEDNTKTISVKEFEKALRTWNFPRATKQVFHMLDKDANGKLEMDDVIFLEKWQPLEFLLVHPDHKAKEEFKELLLAKMTRYLKGWKRILDKDNTNRCNWYEFQEACRVLGFRGNIGGAWRAFDEDLSGPI
eukprot:symbB.v1.2.026106.t1/scaffold2578.1/size75865/7